jgi:hypothetical protein
MMTDKAERQQNQWYNYTDNKLFVGSNTEES